VGCVGYAKNVSQAPLVKSIETSPGCDSHRPHVCTIKQNWEDVNVIQAEFGWKRDECLPDTAVQGSHTGAGELNSSMDVGVCLLGQWMNPGRQMCQLR